MAVTVLPLLMLGTYNRYRQWGEAGEIFETGEKPERSRGEAGERPASSSRGTSVNLGRRDGGENYYRLLQDWWVREDKGKSGEVENNFKKTSDEGFK